MGQLRKELQFSITTRNGSEDVELVAGGTLVFDVESDVLADSAAIERWIGAQIGTMTRGIGILVEKLYPDGVALAPASTSSSTSTAAPLSPEEQADFDGEPADPFFGKGHGLLVRKDETPADRVWRHRAELARQHAYNGAQRDAAAGLPFQGVDEEAPEWLQNAARRGYNDGAQARAAELAAATPEIVTDRAGVEL